MKKHFLFICLFALGHTLMHSQQAKKINGPVIEDYGATYEIVNPDIETEIDTEMKVIFDVDKSSEEKTEVNKYIEVAARFLNMHASAGMKPEQLKAAMTIHAGAAQDVLTNEAYKVKFGVDNPNFELINALTAAGVDVIVCGQSAAKNNMSRETINPNVKIALSATTALIQFQNKGYQFVKY